MCGWPSFGKLEQVLRIAGWCGHVADLFMRQMVPLAVMSFARFGSRSNARTRETCVIVGFPDPVGRVATQQRTIEFLLEQVTGAGAVTVKPMFGEYGVYVDGKMIGSVCDDQLYVKPTASGPAHAEPTSDAPPYPGGKPHLLIEADRWDDAEWLGELLRVTAAELPTPKPRKLKRST